MGSLIEIKNLKVSFEIENLGQKESITGVNGINLEIKEHETLALVGESGSGKSVTSRTILGLLEGNAKINDGLIIFNDLACGGEPKELTKLNEKEFQKIRGNHISMIFQDPLTSLNPTMKVGAQVAESLLNHPDNPFWNGKKLASRTRKKLAITEAIRCLEVVGIDNAQTRHKDYPHQFSGGQRQRIAIASALISNPSLLIADEPTTALDVTIQEQILTLIKRQQSKQKLAVLFITHDLAVVSQIADRVAVMKNGEIVEIGKKEDIFSNPQHPYTKGLIAIAKRDFQKGKKLPVLSDFEKGDE